MTKKHTKYDKTKSTVANKKQTHTKVKTVKETEKEIELQELVAAQLTDRRFAPISYDSLDKRITYVTAKNGLFKVTKTPIGLFKECLQEFDTPILGIPEMEDGVDLAIPKIPFKVILEALSFYVDINTKDKTEASTLYFWNHKHLELPQIPGLRSEGQLVIYCPVQVNSGALSEFGADENVFWMRDNLALLLELHSHNTMSAFFSATDDSNENNTQFYGVWGRVDKDEPEFAFRYVVGDTKKEVDPSVLIDWPSVKRETNTISTETFHFKGDTELIDLNFSEEMIHVSEPEVVVEEQLVKGPFKKVDYPEDWFAQHSKRAPYKYKGAKTTKRGRSSYYSSGYSGGSGWDDYYGSEDYSGYYGNSYGQTQLGLSYEDEEKIEYEGLAIDMFYLDDLLNDDYGLNLKSYDEMEPNKEFRIYMEDFIIDLMSSPEGMNDFY